MRNVWYLAIVVGMSVIGVLILWLRNRPTSTPRSSIERFNDKMNALSPEQAVDGRSRRVGRDPEDRVETS